MLNSKIKACIDKSVLCWVATSDENMPNVSPKEVFTYFKDKYIIVANIASPQTIQNIGKNPNVCISFIDIFVQKGYQIKGRATILKKTDAHFLEMEEMLLKITKGKFPFKSITCISVDSVKPIIAPSYLFFPEITEFQHIEDAKKTYGV